MKLVLKILLGICAVVVLVLATGLWLVSGAPTPSIPPRKTEAPEGFDPSRFPELAALSSTNTVKVTDLGQFGRHFEHYFIPEENALYLVFVAENDETRVIILNQSGDMIADFLESRGGFKMGRYFVGPDRYRVLQDNQISAWRPMEVIEGDLSPEEVQNLIDESTHYRSYGWSDMDRDSVAYRDRLTTHILRQNGIWRKYTTPRRDYFEWKGVDFEDLEAQYSLTAAPTDREKSLFADGKYYGYLVYFDQQEYFAGRAAPMGSTTGQGRPAHWRGTGYYKIKAGEESVNFRIENDTQNISGGRTFLTVQGHEDLDFVLVKHEQNPNPTKIFAVSAP